MDGDLIFSRRKSYMDMGEIFFWTATINSWQCLLLEDGYKNIIIDSLTYLSDSGKIDVFGLVPIAIGIPNHIHLIWRINEMNGKETSQGSFLKYTAHALKKMLKTDKDNSLASYAVDANDKSYEIWKRDSLAIHLFSKEMAYQKLDYLHYNPCTEYWQLVKESGDYLFSSTKFYEKGVKNYIFLKDLRDEF